MSTSERHRELVLRIGEPATGFGAILAYGWQEQTYVRIHLYLFGKDAPAVVARDEPAWRTWMEEHFPSAG